jgi:DNA-binding MarR family transcriptional regulator
MTKQALGELVDGLEDGGYAVASRLKTDRRVRIVTRTPAGSQLLAADLAAAAALEQEWRNVIGHRRYDTRKAVLHELAGRPSAEPGRKGVTYVLQPTVLVQFDTPSTSG